MTSLFITVATVHYCLAVPLILHSHKYLPSDFATTSSGLSWGKYPFPYILMNIVLTLLPVVVYFIGNLQTLPLPWVGWAELCTLQAILTLSWLTQNQMVTLLQIGRAEAYLWQDITTLPQPTPHLISSWSPWPWHQSPLSLLLKHFCNRFNPVQRA